MAQNVSSVPCHLPGITRICFSPDGNSIFTGGVDCLVRIHDASKPDSEPAFHDNHTDEITSLTCSRTNLITACKDNISRVFSHPENEFQGFITRSAGVPIRWVSVNQPGDKVAVCSDDLLVKIVNVKDTSQVSLLSDNTKSVRSAAWDPSGQYLVTACCDGKLKIYDMSGTTPLNLKIMDGVVGQSEPESDVSCYVAWHPSGKYFAAPLRTNDIGMVSREGWSKQWTLSQEGHKSVVGELAWSPNGRYLASAAASEILVWSTDSRVVISRHNLTEGKVTGLTWSPNSNLLAFTSTAGTFSRWVDPIPVDLTSPFATDVQEKKRVEKLLDDFADDGGDIDMDDRGEDIGDDGGEDDWIVDDEGDYGEEKKWGKGRTEVVNVTKAQQSFTPGSTEMKNKKRYLAFNMIGAVDVTDQESHHVVNVEFHDKSTRRGYHFQDHAKYAFASMGEQGIAFASSEQSSEIHYRPYDSWASSSDWTQNLPSDEGATCIACGGPPENAGMGHIVVSTTKGWIRFFTASGIQRYLWRLGDDVVTLSAGKEAVVVVHREGGTSLDGCQNLRYTIMDLENFDITQTGRIPLPKKATISWLGWTPDGAPVMFDSTGVLSMLDRYRRPSQARWVPILDTSSLKKEGRAERYWPVGVSSSTASCIILKGNEKEPWFPRPLLQDVELHVPLLNTDDQAGKLEESILRGQLLLSIQTDSLDAEYDIKQKRVAIDKELLQLVQSACKSDNLSRAYDLVRMFLNPSMVDAAAKIADFYHLGGLEERILSLKGDARSRERRAEKMQREREKERERRYGPDWAAAAGTNGTPARNGANLDFAPRGGPRRSFGGVLANGRAETPVSTAATRVQGREAFVPETPGDETTDRVEAREGSPDGKRKREADSLEFVSSKKEEILSDEPKKNPFAKKPPSSNPFAKPAVAKPLDGVKSTSFFERVDNIETSGAPKSKFKTAAKPSTKGVQPNGKQTTLMGMKKAAMPAKTLVVNSLDEVNVEETQVEETQVGILEESNVQERLASPDWPDTMTDDA